METATGIVILDFGLPHMHATGIEIGQTLHQAGRQVVVKEKFHFVITVR